MIILAKRLIAYLKTKADLLALLSDSNSIFIENAPLKKLKYITVSTNIGEDGNCVPANEGTITLMAIVSREITNAQSICLSIADKIDTYVNKQENLLADATYVVRLFVREGETELLFDESDKTYYVPLSYKYILDVS